jgi:tetratricopeptide (TPR) repeat protein
VAADGAALASFLVAEEKYDEAEPLLRRALITFETVLGPDSCEAALVSHELADLLTVRGRTDEARSFYERALSIRRSALGSDHPDVATTLHNLALLYEAEGRSAEAQALWVDARAGLGTPVRTGP